MLAGQVGEPIKLTGSKRPKPWSVEGYCRPSAALGEGPPTGISCHCQDSLALGDVENPAKLLDVLSDVSPIRVAVKACYADGSSCAVEVRCAEHVARFCPCY